MLILSRKPGEQIVIGSAIVVSVKAVKGMRVQIAIDAPVHVPVVRGELQTDRLIAGAKIEVIDK